MNIRCTNCHQPYPEDETPYHCPVCTGLYDFTAWPVFDPLQVDRNRPGIWRYRHVLGLPENAPEITLGEGSTPMVWGEAFGRRVAYKLDFLNPTGSFKDRGAAVLAAFLKSRGVSQVVEDSAGNAGAAFAAYAAAAGLRARIFVPDSASGPKRRQIEAYGAEVVRIMGPRSNAAEAARLAAQSDAAYASHAFLPQALPGYATLAYEIWEQLGGPPGSLVVPAGQGNLLLAIARGFEALHAVGQIDRYPILVGVQALACAPLWSLYSYGPAGMGWVTERETLAEGVRIRHPARGDAVLQTLERHQGRWLAVDEPAILPGQAQLAHRGFYVEPTSALVWNTLEQCIDELADPVVVVLTGSGLKTG